MRARQLVYVAVCVVTLIASSMTANAGVIAVDFNPPGDLQLDYYDDDVAGFKFTVGADDIMVTDLGFYDYYYNGLGVEHPVGIYDFDTEALIVSTTVPKGTAATLDGQFRFVAITPTKLDANSDYVIVGYRPTAIDPIAFNVAGLTVAPYIHDVDNVAKNETGGLVFAGDDTFTGANNGWFGPNFKADVVPEPSSCILLGVALLGLAWMWRKRK